MSKNRNQKLVTPEIFHQAVIGSFTKLNPRYMMKNPVMFVVEVGCIKMCIRDRPGKVLSDSDFADHPWTPGSVWTGGLVFCLNEAGLFFRGAAGIDWK